MDAFGTEPVEDVEVDDLFDQASGNLQSMAIATIAFLAERGIDPSDWARAYGARIAPAWGDEEGWTAGEFLEAMLFNYRTFGGETVTSDLGDDRATATIVNFPDAEFCELLGVERDAVLPVHDIPVPIASARGLVWSWADDGEQTTITVTASA